MRSAERRELPFKRSVIDVVIDNPEMERQLEAAGYKINRDEYQLFLYQTEQADG